MLDKLANFMCAADKPNKKQRRLLSESLVSMNGIDFFPEDFCTD